MSFNNIDRTTLNNVKNTFNNVSTKVSNTISKRRNNLVDTYDTLKNTVSNKIDNVKERVEDVTGSSFGWTLIKVLLVVIIIVILLHLAKYYYTNYALQSLNSPYLLEKTKNGKHALVISQDPENKSSRIIKRSEGRNGIEFSYQFSGITLLDAFDIT